MYFSFFACLQVYIFLEIASVEAIISQIFQEGMRNWFTCVSRRELEVFNLQVGDSCIMHESWQVHTLESTKSIIVCAI